VCAICDGRNVRMQDLGSTALAAGLIPDVRLKTFRTKRSNADLAQALLWDFQT
jgi:hypothetical protein